MSKKLQDKPWETLGIFCGSDTEEWVWGDFDVIVGNTVEYTEGIPGVCLSLEGKLDARDCRMVARFFNALGHLLEKEEKQATEEGYHRERI